MMLFSTSCGIVKSSQKYPVGLQVFGNPKISENTNNDACEVFFQYFIIVESPKRYRRRSKSAWLNFPEVFGNF
jgi:hypothetical protein